MNIISYQIIFFGAYNYQTFMTIHKNHFIDRYKSCESLSVEISVESKEVVNFSHSNN